MRRQQAREWWLHDTWFENNGVHWRIELFNIPVNQDPFTARNVCYAHFLLSVK
ncbi:MAG: hypothetical protein ACOCS8_00260 [Desulfovermiculus sp.]